MALDLSASPSVLLSIIQYVDVEYPQLNYSLEVYIAFLLCPTTLPNGLGPNTVQIKRTHPKEAV
jgi:hypothetical protein